MVFALADQPALAANAGQRKPKAAKKQSSKVKIHGGRFPLLNLVYRLWHAAWSSSLPLSDKLAFTLAFPGALPARYLIARRRVI